MHRDTYWQRNQHNWCSLCSEQDLLQKGFYAHLSCLAILHWEKAVFFIRLCKTNFPFVSIFSHVWDGHHPYSLSLHLKSWTCTSFSFEGEVTGPTSVMPCLVWCYMYFCSHWLFVHLSSLFSGKEALSDLLSPSTCSSDSVVSHHTRFWLGSHFHFTGYSSQYTQSAWPTAYHSLSEYWRAGWIEKLPWKFITPDVISSIGLIT